MIDGSVVSSEKTPRAIPYSLSKRDFIIPPKEITRYHNGERITRNNFTSFLVNGFALSMGIGDAHRSYFHWLEMNEGFDGFETISNFLVAGGKDVLSDEEKTAIFSAYKQVRKHDRYFGVAHAVASFVGQLSMVSALKDYTLPLGDLEGMPFQELVSKIRAERDRKDRERNHGY